MNTALLNRLNTAKSVLKTFNDFQSVVDDVPALRDLKVQLSNKIASANGLLNQLERDLSAHTAAKQRVAEEVFSMGATLASSLSNLAKKQKDDVLMAAAVKSVSALKAGKSNEVLARLQNLRDGLAANRENLAPYKVTEADITDFTTKVAQYEQTVNGPRLARDERAVLNQSFSASIAELSELLRSDVADVVAALQAKHPDFSTAFNQSAKIVRVVTASRSARRKPAAKKAVPKVAAAPTAPVAAEETDGFRDTGGSPFNR